MIASDIERFWRAFDMAKGKEENLQEEIYQTIYIDSATAGLQSWIEKRDKNVSELVDGVNSMLPFYRSIRDNTLKTVEYEMEIRAGFYALKYLYPKARFPDVYFFIWYFLATGSTTTDEGLLIAMEAQSVAKDTPLDRLPEVQHDMVRSLNLENLAAVVVHESVHLQQSDYSTKNLLELSIREGTADFIAELATGRNPSQAAHAYANPRERELWKEFKSRMYTKKYDGWLGIPKDRPAGMAYWMGYKIVKSYYSLQENKQDALRTLIETIDYEKIFKGSKYSEKFK